VYARQVLDVQEKQVRWKPSTDLAVALATCSPLPVRPRAPGVLQPDPTSYRRVNAIIAKLQSLVDKGVLVFGALPSTVKDIATKFVFKLKYLPSGLVDKYKVRLVVKGFLQ
jgi:hypothetical protein